MPFDKFDLEELTQERRKAIRQSIRTVSTEELKKIGEEIFHYADVERLDNPDKNWKFSLNHAKERGFWDDKWTPTSKRSGRQQRRIYPGMWCRRITNGSRELLSRRV